MNAAWLLLAWLPIQYTVTQALIAWINRARPDSWDESFEVRLAALSGNLPDQLNGDASWQPSSPTSQP